MLLPSRQKSGPANFVGVFYHFLMAKGSKHLAFTLVEMAIALGIMSFSLVAILGLVPIGLTTLRESMDVTAQAYIIQSLLNEAYLSDRSTLAASTRYFDESGRSVAKQVDISSGKWLYKTQVILSTLTVSDATRSMNLDRGQTFLVVIEAKNRPPSSSWSTATPVASLPRELLVYSVVLLK